MPGISRSDVLAPSVETFPLTSCLRDDFSNFPDTPQDNSRLFSILFPGRKLNRFPSPFFSSSSSFVISVFYRARFRINLKNRIETRSSAPPFIILFTIPQTLASLQKSPSQTSNNMTSMRRMIDFPEAWVKPFLSTYSFTRTVHIRYDRRRCLYAGPP